jgi:Nuclease-related domain
LNIFTNEEYFKAQQKSARRLQLLGTAFLVIVFLISCPISLGYVPNPYLIVLSYPFLLAGFPMLVMGNNRLRRLKTTPHADLLLNNELKGLNNKYSLYHYVQLDGQIIKHLLVSPSGIQVIETRDSLGKVSCKSGPNGDRWRERTGLLERVSGNITPLGNPSRDLQGELEAVRKLLESIGKESVQARGLIVFTRQEDLELEGCSFPAVPLAETKAAVREILGEVDVSRGSKENIALMLTSEDRRRLSTRLSTLITPVAVKPATAAR